MIGRSFFAFIFACIFSAPAVSQQKIDLVAYLQNITAVLASDSLGGRENYTEDLHKAADFIVSEMEKAGLDTPKGFQTHLQPFSRYTSKKKTGAKDGKYDPKFVLFNVVGVMPGITRPEEVVIFSAHYDHVGSRDGIYNGANDNASGVASMLAIMQYYAIKKNNDRTIVFCAFAGEELGLLGSVEYIRHIDHKKVKAVINLEMLGVPDGYGKKTFFVTGAQHSNLEAILKKNLAGTSYTIGKDLAPDRELYKRSDNFPFTLFNVVAHTLMSSDDSYECYHRPCDEFIRLDYHNMAELVKAIIISTSTIVSGGDTPRMNN